MSELVRITVARFDRAWGETAKKQLKFATALALTRTAQAAQREITARIPTLFSNPVERTRSAIYVVPAKKADGEKMFATVMVKNFGGGITAEQYLMAEIRGGGRKDKRGEVALRAMGILPAGLRVVPGDDCKLDAHGNIPGATWRTILTRLKSFSGFASKGKLSDKTRGSLQKRGVAVRQSGTDYFVARKNGVPVGVFQLLTPARRGRKAKIASILRFVRPPRYAERLPFIKMAEASIDRHFPAEMTKALREAMQTARP